MAPPTLLLAPKAHSLNKQWFQNHRVSGLFSSSSFKNTSRALASQPLPVTTKRRYERIRFNARSHEKTNELLEPVLQAYEAIEMQTRVEAFYGFKERFATFKSERIKNQSSN